MAEIVLGIYTAHGPQLNTTPEEWLPLAATGWADTTRIAAGDPNLWTEIFSHNASEVLTALDRFATQLDELRTSLAESDWEQVNAQLQHAKRIRDALGN